MRDLKGLFKWRERQGERRFSDKAEKEEKKLAMADDAEDQQILLQKNKNENENENKKKEVQYPNCPGCKCAYLQHPDAGIPYKEFLSVFLLIFVASIPVSSLYPFLYFMVQDLHITKSDEEIGFYAGLLGASLLVGRALTAVQWGIAADKYGRKPVMVLSLISVMVFHTLFGLSKNFWMALATRFLLGSFNGMHGAVKAYTSEISNQQHQALGISMVGTSWGLALIIGPALGGYLSQPALKYPSVFGEGSLFARYPYFLPSLCNTVLASGALCIIIQLPETLHKHNIKEMEETELLSVVWSQCSKSTEERSGQQMLPVNVIDQELEEFSTPTEDLIAVKQNVKRSLLSRKSFIGAMAVSCIWSFHDMTYSEIFSLWCVSPKATGGLNFTTNNVGKILGISGFALMVFQILIFPHLANSLGLMMATWVPAVLSVPLILAYPIIATLHGWVLWVILNLVSIVKTFFSMMILSASIILLNNSVPHDQRGVANGVSMSVVSVFKAIGPAVGGSLFAWGQKRQDSHILPETQEHKFCIIVCLEFGWIIMHSSSTPTIRS
ncbi:hypothetical protein CY35_12G052400 [Sphagnum magellanicum]|nr:hypothetical protein CY35_12G052400 [Sphagnum magellanicum]KAH9545528.1 hypothetical protein CY35_12G052400 [Sphagnum magellanicum]